LNGVLTKPNAYGRKPGFYEPKNDRVKFLKQVTMQILFITKSEFSPGVKPWQIQKLTNQLFIKS
jgi:hypothetical protein